MSEPCCLAVAYRFGRTNSHQHLVGCWPELAIAVAFATQEHAESGGKYGVAVYAFRGPEYKLVHYVPSSYGEKEPRLNRRIYLCDRLGEHVHSLLDDNRKIRPKELREFLLLQEKLFDGARTEPRDADEAKP